MIQPVLLLPDPATVVTTRAGIVAVARAKLARTSRLAKTGWRSWTLLLFLPSDSGGFSDCHP